MERSVRYFEPRPPPRSETVATRMTPRDRRTVEEAAEEVGTTVSSFLAGAAVRLAREVLDEGEGAGDGEAP